MKHPSQEDLLGFVLGALDAAEHQQIQQLITDNPELESRLLEIKSALLPLDYVDGESDDSGDRARRAGLARRTCEMVSAYQKQADLERDQQLDLAKESALLDQAEAQSLSAAAMTAPANAHALNSSAESNASDNDQDSKSSSPFSMARLSRASRPSSWSLTDFIVGIAACAVLAGILLPAISYSQYNSRLVACQNNLGTLGTAFFEYSDMHDGQFVPIPSSGNLSASGCYAPVLKDAGLLDDDNTLRCQGRQDDTPLHIPTCQQIELANGAELEALRRQMGGDYGYTLGYSDGEQLQVPRSQHRANIVLLSDMPSNALAGRQSNNHRGNGQNCLFENGSVRFLSSPAIGEDLIFENDYGIVAPGSHMNDNVVAPSYIAPMTKIQ